MTDDPAAADSLSSGSALRATERTPEFITALNLMEHGAECLFVTGKAGVGKSTLLQEFRSLSRHTPAMLAPTGTAALNVGGETVHRFFGFAPDVTPAKVRSGKLKPRTDKARMYKRLTCIVMDEVSMVRADLLDCADEFLRMYGPKTDQPFGGVRMIFCGDLLQLPPVLGRDEQDAFYSLYPTPYFFSAHVMRQVDLRVIELTKIYRQSDPVFISLLNKIRENDVASDDITRLNARVKPKTTEAPPSSRPAFAEREDGDDRDDDDAPSTPPRPGTGFRISLTGSNKQADEINKSKLAALKGRLLTAEAEIGGDFSREYFPALQGLQFKEGAQIMLLTNDPKRRWVNGTVGVVTGYGKDETGVPCVDVQLPDRRRPVQVYAYQWELHKLVSEEGALVAKPAGTFKQFPFRLAWAVTIHKSQGKTFDEVSLDLGRGAFAPGQLYVALSRCRTFEGLSLATPVRRGDVRSDERVQMFLEGQRLKEVLRRAAGEEQPVRMRYRSPDGSVTERRILPLEVGVLRYQEKPFPGMKARCLEKLEEVIFRTDRVLEAKAE